MNFSIKWSFRLQVSIVKKHMVLSMVIKIWPIMYGKVHLKIVVFNLHENPLPTLIRDFHTAVLSFASFNCKESYRIEYGNRNLANYVRHFRIRVRRVRIRFFNPVKIKNNDLCTICLIQVFSSSASILSYQREL